MGFQIKKTWETPSAVGKVAMNNSYTIGNMEQDPLVNDDKTVLVVL